MLKFNNQKGLGLIEVLIAIALVLIGLLSLIQIFPLALNVNSSAEQTTIATNLAQAKIEQLFYLDYENITLGAIEAKSRLAADPNNPFYQYWRQTEVEYVDGNLNQSETETGIKLATVTIFWRNPISHLEKSLVFKIIISKK